MWPLGDIDWQRLDQQDGYGHGENHMMLELFDALGESGRSTEEWALGAYGIRPLAAPMTQTQLELLRHLGASACLSALQTCAD